MAVITQQQLEDASTDAIALGNIVNGAADRSNPGHPDGTVTTRTGLTVKTIAKVMVDAQAIVDISTAAAVAARDASVAAKTLSESARDTSVASAAAAAASAASVPVGAGTYITGDGTPGTNVGSVGAFYYDASASLLYGPKTASGWASGRAVGIASTPTRTRYDMRYGGTFPTALFTPNRASVSTDFMYFDPPSYGPGTTFAANTPVIRADIGFGSFQQSQQFLATTAAPGASQTTAANVAVGVCILIGWGPPGSTATPVAGTAVFTGGSALDCAAGSYQVLTVTTAGTITVNCTGGVQFVNLQQCPGLPTITQPVPYIAGAATRSPDLAVATASGRALFGAAGSFIASTNRVSPRALGGLTTPAIIGINGTAALYANTSSAATGGFGITIYDPANHTLTTPNGGLNWATQEVRTGITWDATPTVTFGAGGRFETSFGFQFNNAAAVTQAYLGVGVSSSYGSQCLNGFIQWFETGVVRLSDDDLYAAYSQFAPPKLDDLLRNYTGVGQFRKFLAGYEQAQAGVREFVPVAIVGPSHEAGTGTGTNIRQNGWVPQLATLLESAGVPCTDDFFTYTEGNAFTGGTNAYDSRLTYTGTAPTLSGNSFGGGVIVIPAGSTLTFTPTRSTAKLKLGLFTAASGYGSAEVSIDGGTTAIVPVEGGSATISTTAAAGEFERTFTATLAANAWTIKAISNPVHVDYGFGYNPALKQIVLMNGGKSGYNVTNLAGYTTPEGSYLYPVVNLLKPVLTLGAEDMTNDMLAGGTSWATYSTNLTTILTQLKLNGDVLMFTDPPSRTAAIVPDDGFAGYTTTVQNTIWRYALAVAFEQAVPVYDFFSWKGGGAGYAAMFTAGYYGSDPIHLAKRGQREAKAKTMATFIRRLVGFAG